MKTRILLVAAVLTLTGCYHATVTTSLTPSAQQVKRGFASGWLWGLVPPSTTETTSQCPNGVARVETEISFPNQLAAWLTAYIYTPMTITATCAEAGDQDMS